MPCCSTTTRSAPPTGSREGRRRTIDLVTTTPRAAWARLSVALAGTLCWLLLAFLAGVAVVYVRTALQATWGGPPLWPVAVGVTAVIAVTVLGFTCGVVFPGRFTAPAVAIAVLVLYGTGFRQALGTTAASGTYALLSPDNSPPGIDTGLYYRVAPDLSIVQVMFMGGIAVALFGLLGLASARAVSVGLIACAVAVSGTAFALAGTARPDPAGGWEIPALHSAASDEPVAAAQSCSSGSGFQVCVHQAFRFYLDDVAAALDPVGAEIAGLPGAPAGAREVASVSGGQDVGSGISGHPPVFEFTADRVGPIFGEFYGVPDPVFWRAGFRQGLLGAFLAGPCPVTAAEVLTPAAAPPAAERRLLAGLRLAWLHLRSRRVPAGVFALAACGLVLHAALHWHWTFNAGQYAQQVPLIIETGAAAVIAVTAHSPFGETERATGRWLPGLRLLTAAGMCGLAIALLALGAAGESLNQGILVLARNVSGITGIGLACSLVSGGLLAWTLPLGYMAFCQYALLESWTTPWTWPARPPADRGAWICASVVFAAGLLLFAARGARTRLSDDG